MHGDPATVRVAVTERTIVLADDHALVRGAIRADLEDFGYRVCAEAGDAAEAVRAAVRERPHLVLLDVGMPGGGIEAAREVAGLVPETKIVMLTVCRDDADVAASIAAGAAGYVLKDVDAAHLDALLGAVLDGQVVLPRNPAAT